GDAPQKPTCPDLPPRPGVSSRPRSGGTVPTAPPPPVQPVRPMAGSPKAASKRRTKKPTGATNGAARVITPEPGDFRRYWDSGHTHESLGISPETLLDMYRNMLLQRRFEERAAQMYGRQKIAGFLHLYIGQEAVSTGAVWATRPDDPIITAYRDHGLALARGMSSDVGMAELFGKIDGCSR